LGISKVASGFFSITGCIATALAGAISILVSLILLNRGLKHCSRAISGGIILLPWEI
jgi:hypothetical protein